MDLDKFRKALEFFINNGGSFKRALKEVGCTFSQLYYFLRQNPSFQAEYDNTRALYAHIITDEIPYIADTEVDPNRARVRIEARKWIAGKYLPSEYGERIDVNITQTVDINAAITEARSRVLQPMCNPERIDNNQPIEITEIKRIETDDSKSMVETRDAVEISSEDIFVE